MRSERHKTSTTSTTYEETSLIDPSVIMIFLVLPISTLLQQGDETGVLSKHQHWKTLKHGSLTLMLRPNTSYHVMTPVTLCSINADTSIPEPILS